MTIQIPLQYIQRRDDVFPLSGIPYSKQRFHMSNEDTQQALSRPGECWKAMLISGGLLKVKLMVYWSTKYFSNSYVCGCFKSWVKTSPVLIFNFNLFIGLIFTTLMYWLFTEWQTLTSPLLIYPSSHSNEGLLSPFYRWENSGLKICPSEGSRRPKQPLVSGKCCPRNYFRNL